MAGKRSANSDLNADNWNDDDEPEEAGTFQKASEDVLKRRVVKAARRRLVDTEGSTKSAFGSFTGFKSTSTSNPSNTGSGLFSFLAKTNTESTTTPSLFQSKPPTTNGSTKISENGVGMSTKPTTSSLFSKDTNSLKPMSTEKESASPKKPSEYYAKLKGLNQSVAQWIKTHVDANPVCILTPIFRDYEKYLKEIEQKHGKDLEGPKVEERKSESTLVFKSESKPETSVKEQQEDTLVLGKSGSTLSTEGTSSSWKPEKSIFGKSLKQSLFSSDKSDKSPFMATSTTVSSSSFLTKPLTTDTKKEEEQKKTEEKSSTGLTFPQSSLSTGTFSFGQSTTTNTASAQFSFGGGKPFTFGSGVVQTQSSDDKPAAVENKEEDEDDEPPKPDFKPVTEEGSIYEQKCKVFVKKDSNYSDRGVGTLFLKPAPNDKMQLIVRAVNSLGNLLLNTLLSESIPIKRLNKTNIMLVCLPLPTAEPPPVATLLRVKTPEEADALFEALEKHKK